MRRWAYWPKSCAAASWSPWRSRPIRSAKLAEDVMLLQLDVDFVLTALDRIGQPRLMGCIVFLRDREPTREVRARRQFRPAFSLDRREVGTFGVAAAHGNLGLAGDHPADGVAAVLFNGPLAEVPCAVLEKDGAEHQGLALVADLAGHV